MEVKRHRDRRFQRGEKRTARTEANKVAKRAADRIQCLSQFRKDIKTVNELPRRKQRGITKGSDRYIVASEGVLDPMLRNKRRSKP